MSDYSWFVEIVEHGTDRVEKRIGPCYSELIAERVDGGANINLNHERFYTRIVSDATQKVGA